MNSTLTREKRKRGAQFGHITSPETREKIRLGNLGWKHSDETRRKMSLKQRGRKLSEGTKEKMSLAHLGNKSRAGQKQSLEERMKKSESLKGPKSPFWKGGRNESIKIRSSIEYRLWREAVFARDSFTCIFCGKRGGQLEADHIKRFSDFPELRLAIDNGRTLCKPCHRTTDTWGARGRKKSVIQPLNQ